MTTPVAGSLNRHSYPTNPATQCQIKSWKRRSRASTSVGSGNDGWSARV